MILFGAIIIQMLLGGVYAWSVFTVALVQQYGITQNGSSQIFGTMIALFTIATIAGAKIIAVKGVVLSIRINAFLYIVGHLIPSLFSGSYWSYFIGMGVITGTSIGFGYVAVLEIGISSSKWKKGIITGILTAAFASGTILLTEYAHLLLDVFSFDVLKTLRIIGLTYGPIILACSFIYDAKQVSHKKIESQVYEQVRSEYPKSLFTILWIGIFSGTFAGLMIIGNLYPLALEFGSTISQAKQSLALFSIGNIIGRVTWGVLFDRLGPKRSIVYSQLFLWLSLVPLLFITSPFAVVIIAFCCGIGFGACFVLYAAGLHYYFGQENFSKLYPFCFLGYGLSGLIAPGFGGWISVVTHSFRYAVPFSLMILLLALIISIAKIPKPS